MVLKYTSAPPLEEDAAFRHRRWDGRRHALCSFHVKRRNILARFQHLAVALVACACANGQSRPSVILISVDTLRADRLSCYQPGRPATPHIDALAKSGTLFSQVSAVVPLTLPSHVAMLTSTYPFVNGVEDNGVPFGQGETLATILKNAGYRTAAFVGGFVLDQRFGLSRGFDTYDSPFDLHTKSVADAGDIKRPGALVATAAKRWLDENGTPPFFLFLHFYDLHTPYDLPPGPGPRSGQGGYSAEVAYVDRVIGDFLAYIEGRGLLASSLIVFTSDHGEGLGDHGESTHGYFLYESTLRVPLIIRWPQRGKRLPNDRVREPASLLDVAPTILEIIGLPRDGAMKGQSLIAGMGARETYSESLYARNHFGCAALRALRSGSFKYIDSPHPELYDLSADPLESRNLYGTEKARATAMRQSLMALVSAAPTAKPATPSTDVLNALRSLGYLSGSTAASRLASQIDPKDRISDFELFGHALALASVGRLAESNSLLIKLSGKLPDVADIRISLGLNNQQSGEHAAAVREFRQALERAPLNPQAHFDLALSQFRLHRIVESIHELQAALALEPGYTRAEELLADIYLEKKDYTQARARLDHILSVDPHSYAAHYNLGVLAAMNRDWSLAEDELLACLHTEPGSAEAHNTLGGVYLRRNDLERARAELQQAIRLQPEFALAHFNLGLVFKKQQMMEDAEREFRAALKDNPGFPAARAELEKLEAATKR
jgi:arylsulfatase A-like enzyme/Tfp pilus assembly protein PilF